MKIVNKVPPNFEAVTKKFNVFGKPVVFTYGDTIYAPFVNGPLSEHLIRHEAVHCKQQGDSPESWWKEYLDNPTFRLSQEVEAYREQYKYYCQNKKDIGKQVGFLHDIATDLSSDMYGNIITKEEAIKLIKKP